LKWPDVRVWHQAADPGYPLSGRYRGQTGHGADSPNPSRMT
jgi:hypothetical protein